MSSWRDEFLDKGNRNKQFKIFTELLGKLSISLKEDGIDADGVAVVCVFVVVFTLYQSILI